MNDEKDHLKSGSQPPPLPEDLSKRISPDVPQRTAMPPFAKTIIGIALGLGGAPFASLAVSMLFAMASGSSPIVVGATVLIGLALLAGWLTGAPARGTGFRIFLTLLFATGYVALPIAIITAVCGEMRF